MTTILGVFARDGSPGHIEELVAMAHWMPQQGPDGRRQLTLDSVALGVLLLHETPECIFDTQPASLDLRITPDAPENVVIVADCRIDNRSQLAADLGIAYEILPALPDSQLILAAYLRWGAACTPRLLGDFAFAVYDGRTHSVFCGRDPLGIKPFYYHLRDDLFVFASDVRGVVGHPRVPRRPCERMLARQLRDVVVTDSVATFLDRIVKLPPAHTLMVSQEQVSVERYWRPEEIAPLELPSSADYAAMLRALLEDAVVQRLRTHKPVGAHLSGGLDSSSVAVLAGRMLRARGEALPTYHWQPTPNPGDELGLEYAGLRKICEVEGLTSTNVDLTPEELIDQVTRDICLYHALNLWYEPLIRRTAARDHVRILLSGWGGDEFVSYNGRGWRSEQFWRGHWGEMLRDLWAGPSLIGRTRGVGSTLYRGVLIPALPDRVHRLLYGRNGGAQYTTCATPAFAKLIAELPPAAPGRTQPTVHRTQLHLLAFGHLNQRTEVWANAGADDQMVYRFPLLDRRLVEFILAAPARLHVQGQTTRHLFRRAVEGLLPPEVQWGQVKQEPVRVERLIEVMHVALTQLLAASPVRPLRHDSGRIDAQRLQALYAGGRRDADPIVQQMTAETSLQVMLAGDALQLT